MTSLTKTLLTLTATGTLSVLAAGLASTTVLAQKKTDWVYPGDNKVDLYWGKTDPKAAKVDPGYGAKFDPKLTYKFDPKLDPKYAPKYDPKKY